MPRETVSFLFPIFVLGNVRTRGRIKLTGFPRDLTFVFSYSSRFSLQQRQKNNGQIKTVDLDLIRTQIDSQNHSNDLQSTLTLIPYIICIFFFLHQLLFLFRDNFENRFLNNLRLHVCVVGSCFVKTGSVSCLLAVTPLSTMLWSCAVMYPKWGTIAEMCHYWGTFDFSQGYVTKNQPMAVPV